MDLKEKYATAEIRESQDKTFEVLIEFHKICEKYNLKYILDFGTLLGAVRHRDYIPWDDDIDVSMPRKDYEKFLAVADKELPSKFKAQNFNNEKNYLQHFTKIRVIDSNIKEEYMAHFDIEHGVWLDVFPYDFRYEDSDAELEKVKKINSWFKKWMFITPVVYSKEEKNDGFIKNSVKKVVIYALIKSQKRDGFIMKKLRKDYLKCEDIISNKDTNNKVSETKMFSYTFNINDEALQRHHLSFESFENRVLIPFRDVELYAPKNYREVLVDRYGDYMQYPPEEERVSRHRMIYK